jgi:virulence-associated protein VagC
MTTPSSLIQIRGFKFSSGRSQEIPLPIDTTFMQEKSGIGPDGKNLLLLPLQLPKKMLQEEDLDSMDLRSQGPMTRLGERNDEKTKSTAIDAFVSKLSATKLGYYNDRYLPIILQSLHREMRKQPIINRGRAENTHMSTLPASSVLIPLQVITPEFNV